MRKISVFLVIAIVVMLSTMLISCESDAASDGLWYQLTTDGSGYVVTSLGNCKDKKIIIPEEYNGKPVVEIAPLAFYYCYSVVEVKMPNTITKIGYSAFEGCNNSIREEMKSKQRCSQLNNKLFSVCSEWNGYKRLYYCFCYNLCTYTLGILISYCNVTIYKKK